MKLFVAFLLLAKLAVHHIAHASLEKKGRDFALPEFLSLHFTGNEAGADDEGDMTYFQRVWSNGDVRLVTSDASGTTEPASGRLEVYMHTLLEGSGDSIGAWGSVCGVGFTMAAANVVCRQLGYATAAKWKPSSETEFGTGNSSVPIFLKGVRCSRRDLTHLMRCRPHTEATFNCSHDSDVAVFCDTRTTLSSSPYRGQVRLVGVSNSSSEASSSAYSSMSTGRVEVFQGNVWGTVCDKQFSQAAADSVCRQLGYTNAVEITSAVPGNGIIWVENITCGVSSSCFKSCFTPHHWAVSCNHSSDVAVRCDYDISLAMENTAGSSAKCSIRLFPLSLLILIVALALTSLLLVGYGVVVVIILLRCWYLRRKKYTPRHYDRLD